MKYILRLNDMALDRQDAIDRCYSLGKRFVEHFEKIYNNPKSETVNHWCTEMQGWLDSVKIITLKQNKKPITYTNLIDWFFTIGSSPEYIFEDENLVDKYEEFLTKLSKYDFKVLKTIKDIF